MGDARFVSGGRVDFATGRGYDRREYEPFGANFEDNASIFAEGVEIVHRLWKRRADLAHGKYYAFENIRVTPAPVQRPIPTYVASFSKPSIELAARLGLGLVVAAGRHVGARRPRRSRGALPRSLRRRGRPPRRLITSYFIHFAERRRRSGRRASGSFATTRNARRTRCRAIRKRSRRTTATSPAS